MKKIRMTSDHFLVIAERLQRDRWRFCFRVRDPRRPYTISFTIGRYAPNRKRSF